MELTAIYHRPESEYAYLYKDGQLHIRIRTKKEDIKRIVLHYGDPFVFIEDLYEATKEMDKVTTDDLFDYWQVSVSVRHARIQYLFELEDTAGEKILYGDRGVAAYTKENLDFVMNGFKLPFIHEIDGCAVPDWVAQTVWYQIFPERFAYGNPAISPKGVRPWDASIAPQVLDFFGGDLQGIIDHLDYLQDDGSGSPLILIDGQVRSSLSDINPDDIESMEVLKDAGATAIYGARANDGVILVTTKRGKSGRAEVNLKAKFGLNYFKNSYEFLDAGDYIYWMRMGYKNAYMGDMKHPDGSAVKAWSSLSSLTSATPYGTGNAYFASDGPI